MSKGKLDTTGYEDIQLECTDRDHKGDRLFWWEAGEQAFIAKLVSEGKKNRDGTPMAVNEPRRCKDCRQKRRAEREAKENH